MNSIEKGNPNLWEEIRDKIVLWSLIFVVKGLGITPFRLLYRYSDLLFYLLYYVFRYRRKVVHSNLTHAFPNKNAGDITQIAKRFYRNFCDILLESIKGLTMSEEALRRRYVFTNPEIFDELYRNDGSALLLAAHFNNWEWGVLSFSLWARHTVMGIYKPLNNKAIDAYLHAKRRRWGLHLSSMSQTGRAVIRYRGKPTLFVFIADQTPSDLSNTHWVTFLNRETAFLHGVDKLARETGYPVYYIDIQRKRRGYYKVSFSEFHLNPTGLSEGSITKMYAARLEEVIRKYPENWLWSHRRWKHRKSAQPQD